MTLPPNIPKRPREGFYDSIAVLLLLGALFIIALVVFVAMTLFSRL